MKHHDLDRQSKRIRELFESASAASASDPELQAHWARYLCILISGLLENAIELIYAEFARRTSDPAVSRFVSKQLGRVNNPNDEVFLKTAGSFKDSWRIDLEAYLDTDGRKEAINGIVNTRNQIAHGGDTGISIVILRDYFKKSLSVIEFVEKQVGI